MSEGHDNMNRQTMSHGEVRDFVAGRACEVNGLRNVARCVDGRYEGNGDLPSLAKPGADVGDMMVSLAALEQLGLPVDDSIRGKVFDAVVGVVGGAEKFHFHTDDGSEGLAAGCGHIREARLDPQAYGLSSADMAAIDRKLAELKGTGANEEVLLGSHGEQAVVVVDSPELHLSPNDDGTQVFVYQKKLDEERRAKVAEAVSSAVGVDSSALLAAMSAVSEKQTGETLSRLAKGLPVYSVTGTAEAPTVAVL